MSLKVWLPLNGTLENKGISDVQFVSGTPSYKVGKIGASALNLNNRIVFDCPALANLQTFSICFWGMAEASTTLTVNWTDLMGFTDVSASGSNGTFRWETGYNGNNGIHWHDNATNAMVNGAHNHITQHGFWKHCCVVFDYAAGKLYSYDDGVLTQTHTHAGGHFNSTGRFYLGETNKIEGRITDVRIYDHALSAAEVREISQGLIMHYKLDDIYQDIVFDSSGYGHNGELYSAGNIELIDSAPKYDKCIDLQSSTASVNCGQSAYINSSFTYNCWMKTSQVLASGGGFLSSVQTYGVGFKANSSSFYFDVYVGSAFAYVASLKTVTELSDNIWHMYTGIYNQELNQIQMYIDGELQGTTSVEGALRYNTSTVLWIGAEAKASLTVPTTGLIGQMSDVRIYATALSEADIKDLYKLGARIDNEQNIHTQEFIETNKNLFSSTLWTSSYGNHEPNQSPFLSYTDQGEPLFNVNSTHAGSAYIEINPTNKTYYYDMILSVNTGNQAYIGFQRYDANKTSRSNNATVYIYQTKPTADIVKQRFTGTVNLSTDGVNPCKYISLRVLNGWSGTTSGVTGTLIIHRFSLREVENMQYPQITEQSQLITEELNEWNNAKFYKSGIIESNHLIER